MTDDTIRSIVEARLSRACITHAWVVVASDRMECAKCSELGDPSDPAWVRR